MLKPGDVVVVDFPGAAGVKRSPAVVLSTALYHSRRPDVIVDLLTTNVRAATEPTDHVLQDRAAAGLYQPSAFRSYVVTLTDGSLPPIGQLSDCNWRAVRACLARAVDIC